MNLLVKMVAIVVVVFATNTANAQPPLPSIDKVINHLNELFRSNSSQAQITMKVVTVNFKRDLTIQSWTRGKDDALFVVRKPARQAGQATLRTKDGLWSYAPRADRLVRIPNSLLSDNWMGSHFTNDDLMRETDFTEDYDTSLTWVKESGKQFLQAILTPKPNAPVVWSSIKYMLEPKDYLPLRADYIDGNKIMRTMTFENPQVIDGKRVPLTMLMVPLDKPGESTRIDYQELKFNIPVTSTLFTQRGLRREAKR
ncbi:MAG: outer membrane lipoprotein-sorting protein [Deltaproteobacteria bacterium]|nr:outer membrane lipoprotein-sorting protein [Deltaproteobacteria bacterium]